jgi:hypothetical protein
MILIIDNVMNLPISFEIIFILFENDYFFYNNSFRATNVRTTQGCQSYMGTSYWQQYNDAQQLKLGSL